MKAVLMFLQITVLYMIYLAGKWIQVTFDLIIPGSIIGMLLLLVLLLTGIIKTSWVESGAWLLIQNLPLLFLPVTLGIIQYGDFFKGRGMLLFVIVLISTLCVMLVSGYTSNWIWKRGGQHDDN